LILMNIKIEEIKKFYADQTGLKRIRSKGDKIRCIEVILRNEITHYFPKTQVKCKTITINYIKKIFRKSIFFNLIMRFLEYILDKCNEINKLIKIHLNLSHDVIFHYLVFGGTKRVRFLNQILNLQLYSKRSIAFSQSVEIFTRNWFFAFCEHKGKNVLFISLDIIYDFIYVVALKYDLFNLKGVCFKLFIPFIKSTLTHELLHIITSGWDIFYTMSDFHYLTELINTILEAHVMVSNLSYYQSIISPFQTGYNSILTYNQNFPFIHIFFWLFSNHGSQIIKFCVTEQTNNHHEAFFTKKFQILYTSLLSNRWILLFKEDAVEFTKMAREFEFLYKILISYEFAILMTFLHPDLQFFIKSQFLTKINIQNKKERDSTVFSFLIIIFLHLILKYFIKNFKSSFLNRLYEACNSWV